MSSRAKAELALLGITFIWGTTFTITKDVLAHIDALPFLSLRFLLAALVVVVLLWKDVRRGRWRDLIPGAWIGLVLWISFTFQITGLQYTTPSKSAFVTGFSVILVPLFEALARRKAPGTLNLCCAASALIGLYLLSGTRAVIPMDRGIFLTLLCAIGFAVHIMLVDRFAASCNLNVLVATQIVVTAVASTLLALRGGLPEIHLSIRIVVALFVTAVLATALAFYVQNWAQKHTQPSRAALIFSMEPVFAAMVTYVALHEHWTRRMAVGCGLIFLGIIASELLRKKTTPIESMS